MNKKDKKSEKTKNEQEQAQANKFDKIIKENILPSVLTLINQVLKLDISVNNLSDLPEQIQTTVEREPDVLKMVNFPNEPQKNFILHIEFQTFNNDEMHRRMAEYYIILHRKHKVPLLQFVIYIGNEKMNMESEIQHENLSFKYNLFDIGSVNYNSFLDSDIPEVVMLGILAGFGHEEKEEVLEKLLTKIVTLSTTLPRYKNTNIKDKFVTQFRILSKVKKLHNFIPQILKKMALIFNIEEDEFYQEGVKKTLEKANLEKKLEKEQLIQKNILKAHNKGMKIHDLADVFDISIEEVKTIIKNAK